LPIPRLESGLKIAAGSASISTVRGWASGYFMSGKAKGPSKVKTLIQNGNPSPPSYTFPFWDSRIGI